MILKTLFASSAFGLMFTGSSFGAALMFDFGPTTVINSARTNSPYHTVTGSGELTWNQIQLADVSGGLVDGNNVAVTGVGINLGRTANSSTATLIDLADQPSGNLGLGGTINTGVYNETSVGKDAIYADSVTANTRGLGVQVTGLAAGTYNVYVTTRNTNAAAQTMTTYFSTGTAGVNFDYSGYQSAALTFPAGATSSTGAWIAEGLPNENYVRFTITLDGTQALNLGIAASDGQTRGFINSLQIVAVPEPGVTLLLGASVLGLVLRRRRIG